MNGHAQSDEAASITAFTHPPSVARSVGKCVASFPPVLNHDINRSQLRIALVSMLDRVLGWLGLQRTSGTQRRGPEGPASGASGSLPLQGAPVHGRFYYGPGGTSTTPPNISSYPPFPIQSIPPPHLPSTLPGNTGFAPLYPGAPPQPWGSMQSFYGLPPVWPMHGYPHSGVPPYMSATGNVGEEVARTALSPPELQQTSAPANSVHRRSSEVHPVHPQVTQLTGTPHGHASTATPVSAEEQGQSRIRSIIMLHLNLVQ